MSLAKRTIHEHLKNLLKEGFVERSRIFNKDGSWYFLWKITQKGNEVSKSFENIEKIKSECEKDVFRDF
jgi:predicted transcriptional regulator